MDEGGTTGDQKSSLGELINIQMEVWANIMEHIHPRLKNLTEFPYSSVMKEISLKLKNP